MRMRRWDTYSTKTRLIFCNEKRKTYIEPWSKHQHCSREQINKNIPRLALNNWQASLCVSPLARISSSNRAGLELSTAPPKAVVPSHPNSRTSFLAVGPRISAWRAEVVVVVVVVVLVVVANAAVAVVPVPMTATNAVTVLFMADMANKNRAVQSFMIIIRNVTNTNERNHWSYGTKSNNDAADVYEGVTRGRLRFLSSSSATWQSVFER